MMRPQYQPFPAQVIEQRANALLRQFARNQKWQPEPPVPVDEILELTMKYHLSYGDLSAEVGVGVMGALYPEVREVRIDSSLEHPSGNVGRHNFTIAHEVGHAALHASAPQVLATHMVANGGIVCRTSFSTVFDKEADRFAACLLMPAQMVRKALRRGDVIVEENVYCAVDESYVFVEYDFPGMVRQFAAIFKVSLSAMEFRLKELMLGPCSYEIK